MSRYQDVYSDRDDYRYERPIELRRTVSSRSGNYRRSRSREGGERVIISRPRVELSPERVYYGPSTPPRISPSLYRSSSTDGPSVARPERRRTRSVERVQHVSAEQNALENLVMKTDACMDSLRELQTVCEDKFARATDHSSGFTFRDIAKSAEEQRFKLKVWMMEVRLHQEGVRLVSGGLDVIAIITNTFRTIDDTTRETANICRRARASDLESDSRRYASRYDDDDDEDPLGEQIEDNLSANESVIQSLALLTDSVKSALEVRKKEKQPSIRQSRLRMSTHAVPVLELREEISAPKQELIEDSVIQDLVTYFGSNDRVRRHQTTPHRTASATLQEAKLLYGGEDSIRIIDKRRAEKERLRMPEPRIIELRSETAPTYAKVHRKHLDVATLDYYDLSWEYDPNDSNYIIILEQLDQQETRTLFEHTRRLRTARSRSSSREGDGQYLIIRETTSRTPERDRESRERSRRSSGDLEVRDRYRRSSDYGDRIDRLQPY